MPETWFISDTHFGHENVLKFCPSRAVLGETIEEHDEALIQRWNEMVRPEDKVYHLGDVAFGRRKQDLRWMRRLMGKIMLLRGNHDTGQCGQWLKFVHEVLPSVTPLPGLGDVVLSHAPLHYACLTHRWSLNVHGHMHETVVLDPKKPTGFADKRYMNVAVEQIDFRPVHLDAVLMRLRQNVAPAGRSTLNARFFSKPRKVGDSK